MHFYRVTELANMKQDPMILKKYIDLFYFE